MSVIDEYFEVLSEAGRREDADFQFSVTPIQGEVEVLQVTVRGRERLPIYMSISGSQLLCVAHLFPDERVRAELRSEMMEAMLLMNIPMPLSSFAKMGDLYVVFGAMATESPVEDILLELNTLSENSIEAMNSMARFLSPL
ncbi:MAG: DUF2170 family protein [Alphaproteobacteria bacterium]|nr:DUF2170 family protein [Alphaproteobacteria bacterium]